MYDLRQLLLYLPTYLSPSSPTTHTSTHTESTIYLNEVVDGDGLRACFPCSLPQRHRRSCCGEAGVGAALATMSRRNGGGGRGGGGYPGTHTIITHAHIHTQECRQIGKQHI